MRKTTHAKSQEIDPIAKTGRPCVSCGHPKREEIDRKLKAGTSFADVSRWLKDTGERPITAPALGTHAKNHLAVEPIRGRRPVSGDFLESVRDAAHEALASGELNVTLKDGITAQKALDARAARDLDRDIWAKVTIALTGGAKLSLPVPRDPELDAIEGEFRELLTAG
jgi:hypothetical protein